MNNFYTLLASQKITIDENGDVIYHTIERCGNRKLDEILSMDGYSD